MLTRILGIRGRQWGMAGLLFVATYVSNGATDGIMMPPRTDATPVASLAAPANILADNDLTPAAPALPAELADASSASASLRQ